MTKTKEKIEVFNDYYLFDSNFFINLLEISDNEKEKTELKVIIDTNYLIQINQEDLLHLFFDRNYLRKNNSALKKQMAMLFMCGNSGEIRIYISNMISREFVRIAPEKIGLLPHYKKYLNVIGSKRELESYFLDLANLLTYRANKNGFRAEIMDTYSYLIANLANVKYFITEDSDLKGFYNYVIKIFNSEYKEKQKEIDEILNKCQGLCDIKSEDFPVRQILERLFLTDYITIPISIKEVSRELPKIEEDAQIIISMCKINNEIISFPELGKNYKNIIDDFQRELIKICTKMDNELPKKNGKIDVYSLAPILIENEKLWRLPSNVSELHKKIFSALEELYSQLLKEDRPYYDLEEEFTEECFELEPKIKCKCGNEFSSIIFYGGIVAFDEREMGKELMHVWNNEINCPECGRLLTVELTLWEYPEGCLNSVDFDDSECPILNIKKLGSKIGIIIE